MLNTLTNNPNLALTNRNAKSLNRLESSASANMNKTALKNDSDQFMRKPADVSFCGFFNTAKNIKSFVKNQQIALDRKMQKLYTNKNLHKVLDFARDQQLVFGATFALVLTCIMRPAAIIIMPSKKNKEDQKYASAHSIASGVIGFAISTVLFYPIGEAIKKFGKDHKAFVKTFDKDLKPNSYLRNDKNYAIAKTFMDRSPDLITAVPKGILTVALIPPILKYVFGLKKNKKETNENINQIMTDYSLLNFKSKEHDNKFQSFMGGVK